MIAKPALLAAAFYGLVLTLPTAAENASPAATTTTTTNTAASAGANSAAKPMPVDIESDQMEVQDKEKKAIFRGHVIAKRTDVTLNSDVLSVDYADVQQSDGSTKTDVTHIEATGNVVIITAKEKITGEWAKMDPKTNELEVGGKDVVVVQGATVIHGGHLSANLNTHKMEVTGGRVKGSFLPK